MTVYTSGMQMITQRDFWKLKSPLGISRGSIGSTCTVRVEVKDVHTDEQGIVREYIGQGECCPTYRNGLHKSGGWVGKIFGESDVTETLRLWRQYRHIRHANDARAVCEQIQSSMSASSARNALDCSLWDIEAKKTGVQVWDRLRHEYADLFGDIVQLKPLQICATVGIDTPENMAKKAAELAKTYTILKIKLGGKVRTGEATDIERLHAVRAAAPTTRLWVDANEGWTCENLADYIRACEEVRVELLEQPVPAGCEKCLTDVQTHIPLCADEAFHTREDFDSIAPYYHAVNIKLDKTGGLTEALECARIAKKCGLKIMSGCMLGTSLSLAPQFYLAQVADYVDADCAYLLEKDIDHGMRYEGDLLYPPECALWG